ncbi:MAG TPA: hypothetical protein VGL94_02735 [Ktedonobacteraceae bacterium]
MISIKTFGLIILSLLGIFVFGWILWGIGVGLGIISLAPHGLSNKVQMNHGIIDETVNAKNCLQWQDWFKTSEASIQTLQSTVENAQGAIDQFKQDNQKPYSDAQQQQLSQLQMNLTGAKNEANDAINTYNAKAKQENLAYCKNGLPIFIHPF